MPGVKTMDHGLVTNVDHPVPQRVRVGCSHCDPLAVSAAEAERLNAAAAVIDWNSTPHETHTVTAEVSATAVSVFVCGSCGKRFEGAITLTAPAACARCGGALHPEAFGHADSREEAPAESPMAALAKAIDEVLGPEVVIEAEPTGKEEPK